MLMNIFNKLLKFIGLEKEFEFKKPYKEDRSYISDEENNFNSDIFKVPKYLERV